MLPVEHNIQVYQGEYITLTGVYYWDLFIWAGNRPVKCLVKGKILIKQGISNRGK